MQYEVEINGRLRHVRVRRGDGAFVVTIDSREWTVDAARVDGHTLSLLMGPEVRLKPDATTDAQVGVIPDPAGAAGLASEVRRSLRTSHEVTVGADSTPGQLIVSVRSVPVTVSLNGRRRWGRKEQSGHIGPQRIVAPMPGKIVRILVKPGEAVRARQPLLVMEAMKMENELRASCDGAVAELHAREGQSVDAGALLAIVTPN